MNEKEPIYKRIYYWWCRQELMYKIKCYMWYKYNRVHIKTLSPTWHDRDDILLHAAFQILTDFVEKEDPFHHFDIDASYDTKDWYLLRDLYKWWKEDRGKRSDPYQKWINKNIYYKGLRVYVRKPLYNAKGEIYAFTMVRDLPKDLNVKYTECLKKSNELENQWYEEDNKKLRELIRLRHLLWT